MKRILSICIINLFFISLAWTALDFDGNDDQVTIADDDSLDPGTGAFTIAFWYNLVNDDFFRVIFKYEDVNDDYYIQMNLDGNDDFYVGFRGSGGAENLDWVNSGFNTANGWHHFAATRPVNGTGNNHIYIDGVLANSWARIEDNDINPAVDLLISESALPCNGVLAEVVIIKRELTIGEIKNVISRRRIPDSDTKTYLRFDEGALNLAPGGKDFADISGNGNHGTESGSMTDADYVDGAPIQWNQGD